MEKKDVDFIRVENSATLPESCRFLFEGFSKVRAIDLTNVNNTDNVTDMAYMFNGCTNLQGIIFSNSFNTSNVKDMTGMFLYCTSLTTLDLTTFTVSQITDTSKDEDHMMHMFQYCSNLESIIVNQSWKLNNSVKGTDMFDGCYKLVGGKGTFFDSSNKNSVYARIDTPDDYPGYLSTANNLLVYGRLNTDGGRFKLIISFENIYSGSEDYTVKYGDTLSESVNLKYHDSVAQVEISVPAKEMNTRKALVITHDENILFNKEISVADYLRRLCQIYNYDTKDYQMAGSMLRYGAAAQKYFKISTSNLMNKDIDGYNTFDFDPAFGSEYSEETTSINATTIQKESALKDFTYSGISLSLDGEINFMMAFKLPSEAGITNWDQYTNRDDVETAIKKYISTDDFKNKTTFRLDGTGKYLLAVTPVNVKNIDSVIYTSAGFGNNISAVTYLYRNYNRSTNTDDLKNVCKSLYAFHQLAKDFN